MVYNMFALGCNLLDLMKKYDVKILERDVNYYAQMILEVLLDNHEKGFICSDLKPGNILVFPPQHGTSLSTLKIADFGLAKQLGVKDTRFGFRGIRYYMSSGSIFEEVSGALDIWSLGCIEVQIVMGRLPWDTRDRDELRDKLLRGESPNILEDMSKLGKSFLKECFAIDPNKR
ncbi:mitogen-activated protein kinase kinase kinase 5-like [Gossypium arboreum]|uniref:Protein kinase domain-containing protein n=1 Tax=Gossypium arboreum TaxID=29729 RepID=A0ABR0N9Q9_GOSAR|nr:mitogen-activated protein kinase kinase kinase 5-like [Gossypium arboreum]KAK5787314.1 hypothetical protein PVK06_041968 [Gossypium arboreum]